MSYRVELTHDAKSDLDCLANYIARHHSIDQATYVIDKLETAVAELSTLAQRGVYPPELLALGIREYRQVFFKPYRIIYRIVGKRVIVLLIADGRRDIAALLAERLLMQE